MQPRVVDTRLSGPGGSACFACGDVGASADTVGGSNRIAVVHADRRIPLAVYGPVFAMAATSSRGRVTKRSVGGSCLRASCGSSGRRASPSGGGRFLAFDSGELCCGGGFDLQRGRRSRGDVVHFEICSTRLRVATPAGTSLSVERRSVGPWSGRFAVGGTSGRRRVASSCGTRSLR